MKKLAITLLILLLLALAGVGYLWATSDLVVTSVEARTVEAAALGPRWDSLAEGLRQGAVPGTVFQPGDPGEAGDYQLITYTLALKNDTWLDADSIEVQITPREGDVLQCYADGLVSLPARSQGLVQAELVTQLGATPVRELTVTYYLWGLPFSLKTSYGG